MNSLLISSSHSSSGEHDRLSIKDNQSSYSVCRGAIDLSNVFTTPATVPLVVGLAFGVSVWAFAPAAAAMNPARDLGE